MTTAEERTIVERALARSKGLNGHTPDADIIPIDVRKAKRVRSRRRRSE